MQTLEDFHLGRVVELGSRRLEEEDIVAFAREFDPQAFHVDAQGAREGPFGGLVASGWHTAAVCMRLLVDALLLDTASLGSPGVEQLTWPSPVRPGDTVTASAEVLEARPSRTRAGRGVVVLLLNARNQRGELVLSMRSAVLVGRPPAAPAS